MYCSFFSGFKNKDVAFFHTDSKVMIQADLLLNLPGKEQVLSLNTRHTIRIVECGTSTLSQHLPEIILA